MAVMKRIARKSVEKLCDGDGVGAVQWAVLAAGSLVTATAAAVSYGLSSYWHTYTVLYSSS
jgi:hypothetical protein